MAVNWTSALISGAGLWDQLDRYDELGSNIVSNLGTQAEQAISQTQFTPFTVSGYGGGATAGPEGVQMQMSPEQQAMSEMLTSQAGGLFQSAAGDPAMREQEIYDRIRAMQQPGEQRAFTDLESRLQAQGRLGLGSSQYGSSPEMFGFQTAVQEAENAASFGAIGEARAQQAQDAQIGTQFQQNAFMPQAQNMNLLNQGFQAAQLNQAGMFAGQNLSSQLGLGAMQTQVNSEKIRAELMAQLFGTAATTASDAGFDPIGDLWSTIFG